MYGRPGICVILVSMRSVLGREFLSFSWRKTSRASGASVPKLEEVCGRGRRARAYISSPG